MKRTLYILLTILCLSASGQLSAQDYARISELSIMGTARYVGMSGAMTAIGADPSAVLDNAAGLGLYQRPEVLFTFDEMLDYTRQVGAPNRQFRPLFMCTHASFVFSVPTYNTSPDGIQTYNFMISYHRLNTYNRTYQASASSDYSFGSQLAHLNLGIPFNTDLFNSDNGLRINEWGYVNRYSFDWAMNIGHRWYVGIGIHLHDYLLSSQAFYRETFADITLAGALYDNQNESSLRLSGMGASLSVGVLYRPLRWLRVGLGLQTPSVGHLRTYTAGTFSSQTDSVRYSYAPDVTSNDHNYHQPLHLSSSVAFQLGAYGMLSMQYDYFHRFSSDPLHSLRAGLEVVPILGFYINAGYAYESSFKKTIPADVDPDFIRQDAYSVLPRNTQYVSGAVGYRGQHFLIQAAYQYRWQHTDVYAHPFASPYDMSSQTHRIVLTFGWHGN